MSKLKYIANISNGISPSLISRRLPGTLESDCVKLIRKHTLKDNKLIPEEMDHIEIYNDASPKYLRDGDILIPKDMSMEAIYLGNVEQKMLATNDFIIVRVTDASILPEYVAWWLNREPARHNIHQNHQRSTYRANILSLDSIKDTEVSAPDIKEQQTVIDATKNIQELERLELRKIKLMKNLITGLAQRIERNGSIKKAPEDNSHDMGL